MRHAIIIGAGPAGLIAAHELAKSGTRVTVFEAANHAGGMAGTFELWGQMVDLGPHRFFSSDTRVNRLWLEAVGPDYRMVNRLTRIYYRGKFFHYPLKPFNALFTLGPVEATRCILSYVRQKLFCLSCEGTTFESWTVGRFGRRLYEIFFKDYTEKLWGIPCTELDSDFASQRIKKLSLFEAVLNALGLVGNARHKTLADKFAYPLGGAGMPYERLMENIRKLGGEVCLGRSVRRVLLRKADGATTRVAAVELADGTIHPCDCVVSTMPLTKLVQGFTDVPEPVLEATRSLRFRNTVIVYFEIDADSIFPDTWLYVNSPDLETGRITNFSNWIPEIRRGKTTTILAMEYWCNENDPAWQADDSFHENRAFRELAKTGLCRTKTGDAQVLNVKVIRIPMSYPVYKRGYKKKVSIVAAYLDSIKGLHAIGRYGSFKYNNQDHSILMGWLAAQKIAVGAHYNLWEVNTDFEDYQEKASITEIGLEVEQGEHKAA